MSEQQSNAKDFQAGDRVRVVLNAEVLMISGDKQWLCLTPVSGSRAWVPIDKFVERITPQGEAPERSNQ